MTRARRVREHLATLLAPTDQPANQDPGGGTPNEAIPDDVLASLQDPAPDPSFGDLVRAHPALVSYAPDLGTHVSVPAKPWIVTPYAGEHDRMALEHARSVAEAMRQAVTNQLDRPKDPHDFARQMDSLVQQLGHALTPGHERT